MDSYDTLVIILSVALGVSILIWIIVGVFVVQILKKLKTASESAVAAVENVEELTSQLRNAGRATAAGSVISQVFKLFKGRK
ncbi:MAG: hypothetical protein Q7T41_03130 [Candidatus Saccharibacteria bacterium]|nr:hypothetical protein [Candidatus Saccharibacteria bacterium]